MLRGGQKFKSCPPPITAMGVRGGMPSKKPYSQMYSSRGADSFYSLKMENPPHLVLLWSQPKTEFMRNFFWGELLSSTKHRWFSSIPSLVDNPPLSYRLRRVLQKRIFVGIPFKKSYHITISQDMHGRV